MIIDRNIYIIIMKVISIEIFITLVMILLRKFSSRLIAIITIISFIIIRLPISIRIIMIVNKLNIKIAIVNIRNNTLILNKSPDCHLNLIWVVLILITITIITKIKAKIKAIIKVITKVIIRKTQEIQVIINVMMMNYTKFQKHVMLVIK